MSLGAPGRARALQQTPLRLAPRPARAPRQRMLIKQGIVSVACSNFGTQDQKRPFLVLTLPKRLSTAHPVVAPTVQTLPGLGRGLLESVMSS